MAAINKSFVIKNGLEVSTNLIFADAPEGKVGIGTTNPQYTLHVSGGIGVTNLYVSGISTTGVLHVGTAGTVITATAAGSVGLGTTNPQYKLHVNGGIGVTNAYVSGITTVLTTLRVGTGGTVLTVLGVGNSIGVGTASPQYLFHINSPVSTGQTALYVQGDVRITGDLSVDDITFDDATLSNITVTEALNVTSPGISTFGGYVDINSNVDISGTLNVSGISSFVGLATFGNGLRVVSGVTTLGVTTVTNITAQNLYVSGIGTIVNGFITNLTGTSGTITTLNSTSGTITNLTGTSGTITTLNSTSGTITNLTGTSGTITTLGSTNGTITNLTGTNVSYSGIGTVGSLNIASTQVISSGRQLQNIASLDATTTATIESAISNAPNTFTDLRVTGIATFTNGPILVGTATSTGTASQPLQVTGGAYVSGNLGIGTTNPTSKLHVIGDVRVSGVVTATTFVGALTGTATSTTNIPNLTGAITSNNTTTSLGSFTSSQLATALTDETGSGSAVFATSPTLVTPVLGAATATSVVVGSGVTINASGINAAGIITATTFIGNMNAGVGTITTLSSTNGTITNLTGTAGTITTFNSTSGTITNLTGTAATIGTVKIVSGIITATSGVVTYYGDGTYLTGTASSPNLQAVLNTGNTSTIGFSITGVSTLTTLNSTSGTITNISGTAGTITTLNSTAGTITNISGTNLNYSGIGTITNLRGVNINVTGIVTATSFVGSGANLTGIANTANIVSTAITTGTLNVTTSAVIGTGVTINASGINVTGVVTASSFVGDGSGLTGAGSTVFDDTTTNQEFFPLFTATTSGTITASGISTSKLTYNPSTGAMTAVDFNSTSDINLKENIHTVGNALEITEQLRGVSFDWKETGRSSYGVIAQELEEVLPELVKQGEVKSVNYNGIIGVLIEAIKELKKEVEDLKRTK